MGSKHNRKRARKRHSEHAQANKALGLTPNGRKIKSTQGSGASDAFGFKRDGTLASTARHKGEFKF